MTSIHRLHSMNNLFYSSSKKVITYEMIPFQPDFLYFLKIQVMQMKLLTQFMLLPVSIFIKNPVKIKKHACIKISTILLNISGRTDIDKTLPFDTVSCDISARFP